MQSQTAYKEVQTKTQEGDQTTFKPSKEQAPFDQIKHISDYSKQLIHDALKNFYSVAKEDLEKLSNQKLPPEEMVTRYHLRTFRDKYTQFLQSFLNEWDTMLSEFQKTLENDEHSEINQLSLVENEAVEQSIKEKKFINAFLKSQDGMIKTLISGLEQICHELEGRENELPFMPLGISRCIQKGFNHCQFENMIQRRLEKQMTTRFFPKVQTLYTGIKRHFENNGFNLDTHDYVKQARSYLDKNEEQNPQSQKKSFEQTSTPRQHTTATPPPYPSSQQNTPYEEQIASQYQDMLSQPSLGQSLRQLLNHSDKTNDASGFSHLSDNIHPFQASGTANSPLLTNSLDQNQLLSNQDLEQLIAKMPMEDFQHMETLQASLRSLLAATETQGKQKQVHQKGENTINLIKLMFDYVKNDHSWIPDVESLIMQLQKSYMRLALLDEKVFEQAEHPARHLLDDVTVLADTISTSNSEGFQLIKQVIDHISNLNSVSSQAFKSQQTRIRDYISQKINPIAIEKELRVKAHAAIHSNKQLLVHEAQKAVDTIVLKPISAIKNPLTVHILIEKIWSQVIYDVYTNFFGNCKEKTHVKSVFNRLLWSTGENENGEVPLEKEKLRRMLPNLLNGVSHCMNYSVIDETLKSNFIEELKRIHKLILDAPDMKKVNLDTASVATTTLANEMLLSQKKQHSQRAKELKDKHEKELHTAKKLGIGYHNAQSAHDTGRNLSKDDYKAALKKLVNLDTNTWINYQINGEHKHCKLAFVSTTLGKYTFVDRLGNKLFDRYKEDLIIDLSKGYANIVETPKTFDRALESIINDIRSNEEPLAKAS